MSVLYTIYLQGCIEHSIGPNKLNKLIYDFITTEELQWRISADISCKGLKRCLKISLMLLYSSTY